MRNENKAPMTLDELRRKYKKDILRIADKYGVTDVRVFGSVARGDAREDSDVDILIRYPTEGFSLMDLGGLQVDLSETVGREVDVVPEQALHWYIKEQVIREAETL